MQRDERGTVIDVRDGMARIRVQPTTDCATCPHKGHCHEEEENPVLYWPVARFAQRPDGVENGLAASDAVIIRESSVPRFLLASLVYIVPLLGLISGAVAGDWSGGDMSAVAGGFIGLTIGGLIAFAIGRIGTWRGWWRLAVERLPVQPGSPDLITLNVGS